MIMSQNPAKQTPEQHCEPNVHVPPKGTQVMGGAANTPPVQVPLQHWAPAVHALQSATHGVLHRRVVGSHTPWQQSPSTRQAAPWAWHTSAAKPQRGGSIVVSQFIEQQPEPGPEEQVSPVGRQSGFERSIWHAPPVQMFE